MDGEKNPPTSRLKNARNEPTDHIPTHESEPESYPDTQQLWKKTEDVFGTPGIEKGLGRPMNILPTYVT